MFPAWLGWGLPHVKVGGVVSKHSGVGDSGVCVTLPCHVNPHVLVLILGVHDLCFPGLKKSIPCQRLQGLMGVGWGSEGFYPPLSLL